ncbi:hypothetical protein BDQ94DRAFT_137826, partial [Aspergillus welwitschiae]
MFIVFRLWLASELICSSRRAESKTYMVQTECVTYACRYCSLKCTKVSPVSIRQHTRRGVSQTLSSQDVTWGLTSRMRQRSDPVI